MARSPRATERRRAGKPHEQKGAMSHRADPDYRRLVGELLDNYEKMVRAIARTGGPHDRAELELVVGQLHELGVDLLARVAQDVPDQATDVSDEDLELVARAHALVVTGLRQSMKLWKRLVAMGKPA
jgi:hypothetical protein